MQDCEMVSIRYVLRSTPAMKDKLHAQAVTTATGEWDEVSTIRLIRIRSEPPLGIEFSWISVTTTVIQDITH